MTYKDINFEWYGKHNPGFKRFLQLKGLPQYWNTNCLNYYNNNYHYYENMKYNNTDRKCKELIDLFEIECQIEINMLEDYAYNKEQIQKRIDMFFGGITKEIE